MNFLQIDCFNVCFNGKQEIKCNLNVHTLEIQKHTALFEKISLIFNVFYQLNGGSAIQTDCFYFHKQTNTFMLEENKIIKRSQIQQCNLFQIDKLYQQMYFQGYQKMKVKMNQGFYIIYYLRPFSDHQQSDFIVLGYSEEKIKINFSFDIANLTQNTNLKSTQSCYSQLFTRQQSQKILRDPYLQSSSFLNYSSILKNNENSLQELKSFISNSSIKNIVMNQINQTLQYQKEKKNEQKQNYSIIYSEQKIKNQNNNQSRFQNIKRIFLCSNDNQFLEYYNKHEKSHQNYNNNNIIQKLQNPPKYNKIFAKIQIDLMDIKNDNILLEKYEDFLNIE